VGLFEFRKANSTHGEATIWNYTDKVKEHFLNPRNVGVIENADGTGEVGALACGDALKLTLKVDSDNKIEDAKFQTFGCASAIASSSALTEMVIGLTLEEAEKITNEDIANYLGGLPRKKMHCSVMGREALQKAIDDFLGHGDAIEQKGEIVCECFGITDLEIENAVIENHLTSIEDVTNFTKAGGGCGQCHEKIQEIIDRIDKKQPVQLKAPVRLTNIQKIRLIEDTLEREIKPALREDGGDIELFDVDGNHVWVRLIGTCSTCSSSQVTLKDYVETKLRELVATDLVVEEMK
jgi:NifU-like protein